LLVGEEMFAAGGYTSDKPAHIGSLRAQDLVRWILIIVILTVSLGALAQQMGMLSGGLTP